jgi:membrane protease YdiL (CAAX protease family)
MSRVYLSGELVVLFVGVPAAMAARILPRVPIVVLLVAASGCLVALLRDPTFNPRWLANVPSALAHAGDVILASLLLALVAIASVRLTSPDALFDLPRSHPKLWALIMLLYPALSVYPQEVIYRAFLFHRYALLLPSEGARVLASAVLFGFAHVFFPRPWVAMSLSFIGGLLFAWHYERTHSLLLAFAEHSVFGQILFTVGLGRFFYAGAARVGRPPGRATG